MILAATVVAWFGQPDARNFSGQVVIAMLSLAMGIQNAMVRAHELPDLATNVMTLTFTGLIADSSAGGGDNRNWRLRGLPVGLFVASAAVGALLLQLGVGWPLLVASFVFSLAMIRLLFGELSTKRMPERN